MAGQGASRSEVAKSLEEVASLAALARAMFKRIDRRGHHSRAWDAAWESLGSAAESLEDLQAEIAAQTTSADRVFTLKELLQEH